MTRDLTPSIIGSLMSFLVCLGLLTFIHLIAAAMMMRRAADRIERLLIAIAILALLAATSLTLVRVFIVPQAPWNEARLVNATAILHGYPLYVRPGTGPIGCYLYGPFGALAFVPAAMLPGSETLRLLIGAALAAGMFFVPAAWLLVCASPGGSTLSRISAFACFCAVAHGISSLETTSVWIHVDAPAIGMTACAAACIIRRRFFAAAMLTAMAVWTKQTMLPIAIVPPVAIWMLGERRVALRTAILIFGLIIGFGLVFACAFDPRSMLFEMVTEPSRHAWGSPLQMIMQIARELVPLIVLLTVAISVRTAPAGSNWLDRNRWLLPLLFAAALLPGGFVGWVKEGGSANNLGLATTFVLVAGCAAMVDCEVPRLLSHRPDARQIGRLIIVLVSTQFVIYAAFSDGLLPWRVRLAMHPFNNGSEWAYRFERAHPGEAYFPWNPDAVLHASGKLYHFDYAVHDRIAAGFPPDEQELNAYLPSNMRYVAYPPSIVPSLAMLDLLRGYDRRIELPELPKSLVFERKDPP